MNEFKSIEEIKEEYAKSHAFDNWSSMYSYLGVLQKQDACNEIAQRYSQQYIDANKELVEMLRQVVYEYEQDEQLYKTIREIKELLKK